MYFVYMISIYAYEALHVSHDQCCSINVIDLGDIFTVDSSNIFRKKSKISAQTVKPVSRYCCYKFRGGAYIQNLCNSVLFSKLSFSQQR